MTQTTQPDCFGFSGKAIELMVQRLGMQEVHNASDGGDFLRLNSAQGPIGFFRVWLGEEGQAVRKMTFLHVANEHIGLDVNLFWALTSRDSIVPHFTCHYNLNPGSQYNYHVDLLPKVDAVFYPEYVEHYFKPLSESFHRAKDITGQWTRPSEHQYLMSGWGLYGDSPDPQMMADMQQIILDYIDHYCSLEEQNIQDQWLTPEYLQRRHDLHLQKIFCRESDPDSYAIMDRILGVDLTDLINDIHVKDGLPKLGS
jgi:hypothetical protein